MKKKLVTHVISGLNTGGAEMMLFKLLMHRVSGVLDARVISLLGGGGFMRERIQSVGIIVDSLYMVRNIPSLCALFYLRRIVQSMKPQIIQGWMYHGNLAATMASYFCKNRPPVVWNVRQSLYHLNHERLITRWVIRANAWLSARPDAIVYNSHISARQHQAFGFRASRTHIIPNGFDTKVFIPDDKARARIRYDLGVDDDMILIGLIGRYHPMKDHKNFLKAASLLVKDLPNIRFLLVGCEVDSDNSVLVSLLDELGLVGLVFLLGERRDIPQLNAALDIATSSSSWGEGFPNAIGEAMCCGIPCVVTDVGDSAWIIGDTGRVVPPHAPRELAMALKDLIMLGYHERRALGALARKRIIDNFCLTAVVRQYEDLYESLIVQAAS